MALFDEAIFDAVIFDTGSTTPTPPASSQDGGSMWGPWTPLRVRPLVHGTVTFTLRPLVATVTGSVLDDDIPIDT